MVPTQTPIAPTLEQASHALRQVLLRLDHYAKGQAQRADPTTRYGTAALTHVGDLQALLTAVEQYEQAALASLAPPPVDVGSLTPAQLLAYREADPVYRLGWVRGHKAGVAQAAQSRDHALSFYAQHAVLPEPAERTPLVQRVQLLLDFWKDPARLTIERLNTLRQQLAGQPEDTFSATLYGTH